MLNKFLRMTATAGSFALASYGAFAADFSLTSSAFKDGTPMDKKFAGDDKSSPNCVGQNISPPLQWSNVPDGAKSLILTVVDPEGNSGFGFVHFVAYNIKPTTTGFAEGELSKASDKWLGGKGTAGNVIWRGPCTPPGYYHHYTFTLISTDLEPNLAAGLTREELFTHVKGHSKGTTGLIGLFTKPQ